MYSYEYILVCRYVYLYTYIHICTSWYLYIYVHRTRYKVHIYILPVVICCIPWSGSMVVQASTWYIVLSTGIYVRTKYSIIFTCSCSSTLYDVRVHRTIAVQGSATLYSYKLHRTSYIVHVLCVEYLVSRLSHVRYTKISKKR